MMVLFDSDMPVHYGFVDLAGEDDWPDLTDARAGQRNGLCGATIPGVLSMITGLHDTLLINDPVKASSKEFLRRGDRDAEERGDVGRRPPLRMRSAGGTRRTYWHTAADHFSRIEQRASRILSAVGHHQT